MNDNRTPDGRTAPMVPIVGVVGENGVVTLTRPLPPPRRFRPRLVKG